jgi:hypothetical protein
MIKRYAELNVHPSGEAFKVFHRITNKNTCVVLKQNVNHRKTCKVLDSQTKKRIDDLRDILVGKIPSPTSTSRTNH